MVKSQCDALAPHLLHECVTPTYSLWQNCRVMEQHLQLAFCAHGDYMGSCELKSAEGLSGNVGHEL